MHVVELGTPRPGEPAILLIHGASANLEDMRALGNVLAHRYQVILVDRPGHGWSELPKGAAYMPLAQQAELFGDLLKTLNISSAIVVGHSLGGALAASLALAKPEIVHGLVLSAPVTHPWPGGITWYYTLTSAAWAGPLFAHTLALPLGLVSFSAGLAAVFAPNLPPADYIERVGGKLVLRPAEFSANAFDVANLYNFVKSQMSRYAELKIPVGIVSGETDGIVLIDLHARAIAAAIPDARLIALPDVGHMPHHTQIETVAGLVDHVAQASRVPGKAD
jgi:pimeloyl-ACP methyl ester carboxylesterase